MQTLKKEVETESISQFQITSDLLRNLYKFDLTPVTKLVLLELTTHLNENRNGSVVFPSIGYIAEVLGIGLTQTKKAISDLIKEGIIIKTKRNNVKGNYNKYLFTSKITGLKKEGVSILSQKGIKMRNSASEWAQNEFFKQSENNLFLYEQKKVTKKQQRGKFLSENIPLKYSVENMGGNVYSGDDEILADYALKHNAKNIQAYVNKLKESGSASKIIKKYKKCTQGVPYLSVEQTKKQIEIYKEYENTAESYESCDAWKEFGKKLGIKK